MENKINIAELLKDCPKGMKLDCTMYDNLYFNELNADYHGTINCYTLIDGIKTSIDFTKYGTFNTHMGAKCVIFPKGKTTWEGFVPPCKFKDGDIVYIKAKGHNHNEFIIIFKEIKNDHIHKHACFAYQVLYTNPNAVCHLVDIEEIRLATEEEKEKLFDAIKANGYKWNVETKTLENVEPKFKDGDIIYVKDKYNRSWCSIMNNCKNEELYTYVDYCIDNNSFYFGVSNSLCYYKNVMEHRLATEEEKQKLFKAIKDKGYKWNAETKTLEDLTESKEDVDDEILMSGIYFDREYYADEVELHLDNYEIEIRDGRTYAVFKKSKN